MKWRICKLLGGPLHGESYWLDVNQRTALFNRLQPRGGELVHCYEILPDDETAIFVNTFHALDSRALRTMAEVVRLPRVFAER